MTPERGATYLWAFDFVLLFSASLVFAIGMLFAIAVPCLILFYISLKWEFEKKSYAERQDEKWLNNEDLDCLVGGSRVWFDNGKWRVY